MCVRISEAFLLQYKGCKQLIIFVVIPGKKIFLCWCIQSSVFNMMTFDPPPSKNMKCVLLLAKLTVLCPSSSLKLFPSRKTQINVVECIQAWLEEKKSFDLSLNL